MRESSCKGLQMHVTRTGCGFEVGCKNQEPNSLLARKFSSARLRTPGTQATTLCQKLVPRCVHHFNKISLHFPFSSPAFSSAEHYKYKGLLHIPPAAVAGAFTTR